MILTAEHLVNNVYPRVRVRQFVISFPKRIRPFLKNQEIRQAVLKIVVQEIESGLITCSTNYPNARAGGVSFFQQFGSSLNFHPHFHLCFADGVFLQKEGGLTFCQSNLSPDDIQDMEDKIRKRVLNLFGRRGWIEKEETKNIMHWENSGFSLNGSVYVESWDRAGLERLLRYCCRPPFVSENFKTYRDMIVYTLPKPTVEGVRSIQLTPLELISRLSKLIPDPRCHQHHYHGILAPNAPLRKKLVHHADKAIDEHVPIIEIPIEPISLEKKSNRNWARLLAKVYEVFPLECECGEGMKIIAFITSPHLAKQILTRFKLSTDPFGAGNYEESEWDRECQLASDTVDGFYTDYDPVPEYEVCDLVPGTSDGFPEESVDPTYWDSS